MKIWWFGFNYYLCIERTPKTSVMVYEITNIDYDTDGEDIDLPEEMTIFIPLAFREDEVSIDEYISDTISNVSGFCHKGFSTELISE